MNTAVASRESYTCSLCLWHAAAKQLRWLIEQGVLVTLILHGEKDRKEVDWVTKSLIQRFRSNSGVTSGDVVIIRAELWKFMYIYIYGRHIPKIPPWSVSFRKYYIHPRILLHSTASLYSCMLFNQRFTSYCRKFSIPILAPTLSARNTILIVHWYSKDSILKQCCPPSIDSFNSSKNSVQLKGSLKIVLYSFN